MVTRRTSCRDWLRSIEFKLWASTTYYRSRVRPKSLWRPSDARPRFSLSLAVECRRRALSYRPAHVMYIGIEARKSIYICSLRRDKRYFKANTTGTTCFLDGVRSLSDADISIIILSARQNFIYVEILILHFVFWYIELYIYWWTMERWSRHRSLFYWIYSLRSVGNRLCSYGKMSWVFSDFCQEFQIKFGWL